MKNIHIALLGITVLLVGAGCQTTISDSDVNSAIDNTNVVVEEEMDDQLDASASDSEESTDEEVESESEDSTTAATDTTTEPAAAEPTYGGAVEVTEKNCVDDECLQFDELTIEALDSAVLDAMNSAIDDEYKALETYNQVIAEFGSVTPFTNIRRAEERHIAALQSLYEKYGYDVPSNSYTNQNLLTVSSVTEACEVGVQAEIDNAALYRNNLLPAVSEHDDVTRVFTNLMNASQDNHLPAFERCAAGESGNGFGGGNGKGNGGGQGQGNGQGGGNH